jgi:hypothetical protein
MNLNIVNSYSLSSSRVGQSLWDLGNNDVVRSDDISTAPIAGQARSVANRTYKSVTQGTMLRELKLV